MTALRVAWTLAAVCAAGLFATWCRDRSSSAERAAAVARAAVLGQRVDSLEAAHAADSTAAAQAVERLADSLHRLDVGLARARGNADSLARAIAQGAGDVVSKRQALEALAAKDVLLMRQAVQLATLTADTTAWRARWLAAAREATAWHVIALDAQQQLEEANKRSAPRWGCTAGLSGLVGGGVTVAKGVNVGPTLAGGLGVTCGLHFGVH